MMVKLCLHNHDESIMSILRFHNYNEIRMKNNKNTTLSDHFQNRIGNKGDNKITEHRAIFQRERQNS